MYLLGILDGTTDPAHFNVTCKDIDLGAVYHLFRAYRYDVTVVASAELLS
jgi:hypothetical protein